MVKEITTKIITINCGEALYIYLKENSLIIDHCSGIPGSENCIYLPDKTSFNWKTNAGIVRINCKESTKETIEYITDYKFEQNGKGDKTRPYSLLVDNEADLLNVVNALKEIEGNCK